MSNPKHDDFQKSVDENPFEGMQVADDSFLGDLTGRYPCPRCGKSRKYFCYTCYVPVTQLEGKLPLVKLPLKIDIIKHKNEIDGKSTAAHAAVLAPSDVQVFTYPDIPNYKNSNVVLIFPSYEALEVEQLFDERNSNDSKSTAHIVMDLPKGFHKTTLMTTKSSSKRLYYRCRQICSVPVDRAVFIDSTWNQSKGIYKDERINSLPCVVLQNRISQFWRHQRGSPRWYLSTIEAIHQFLVEVHLSMWGLNAEYKGLQSCFNAEKLFDMQAKFVETSVNSYIGQYDNLLFFFKHMYKLIHAHYEHDMLYAYKRRLL